MDFGVPDALFLTHVSQPTPPGHPAGWFSAAGHCNLRVGPVGGLLWQARFMFGR